MDRRKDRRTFGSFLSACREWFVNVFNTFGVAILTWAVVGVALYFGSYHSSDDNAIRLFPITYHTAIWVIACLFPLTSTLYLIFDLRLRRNQIQDAAERVQLQYVYFPSSDSAAEDFSRFLHLRFRESCQPWELAIFSLVAAGIAFVGAYLVYCATFKFPNLKDPNEVKVQSEGAMIMFAAFSGSLAGACIFIFNKFRTFDLYPSTYLQASIGFVSGTLAGTFVGSLYPSDKLRFLAFAIGFLTSTNVSFLGTLLRRQVAQLTGTTLPEDKTGDLDAIISNAAAIESLHNISIYSVADLVKAEPLIIYLNLPAHIAVINGWIDEGLVLYYFGPETVALLAKFAVRRFTQLLEMAVETWPAQSHPASEIVWSDRIPLLADSGIENIVMTEMRCIVESGSHNRLLGILSDRYRLTFYPADLRVGHPVAAPTATRLQAVGSEM